MNEATQIRRSHLIERAEEELPEHKRPQVEAAYERAFWFAAGWNEATIDGGNYDVEHGFAVSYTLATLDYPTERVCFRASFVDSWNAYRNAGAA